MSSADNNVAKYTDWDVEEWIERARAQREKERLDRANALLRKLGKPLLIPASERRIRKPRARVPDGLKTRAEAAAKLNCSEKTLDGHVEAGTLRYVVIGHGTKRQRKMFTDADLDAFIADQTRKEAPACPSIESRVRRTGTSTSGAEVIGFSARRNARLAARRKR